MKVDLNPLLIWGDAIRTKVLSGGMPEHKHSMPKASSLARLREMGGFAISGSGFGNPVEDAVASLDTDTRIALLVNRMVLTLRKTDQQMLAQRYVDLRSVDEIAAEYNVQPQTMHNKLSAAKRTVCQMFDAVVAGKGLDGSASFEAQNRSQGRAKSQQGHGSGSGEKTSPGAKQAAKRRRKRSAGAEA